MRGKKLLDEIVARDCNKTRRGKSFSFRKQCPLQNIRTRNSFLHSFNFIMKVVLLYYSRDLGDFKHSICRGIQSFFHFSPLIFSTLSKYSSWKVHPPKNRIWSFLWVTVEWIKVRKFQAERCISSKRLLLNSRNHEYINHHNLMPPAVENQCFKHRSIYDVIRWQLDLCMAYRTFVSRDYPSAAFIILNKYAYFGVVFLLSPWINFLYKFWFKLYLSKSCWEKIHNGYFHTLFEINRQEYSSNSIRNSWRRQKNFYSLWNELLMISRKKNYLIYWFIRLICN